MMNLKYYLRGLGVGIIVTALIMGIALGGKKQTLSDDEIRERAKELGMVEESAVLSDTVAGQSASAASGPDTEDNGAGAVDTPAPLDKSPDSSGEEGADNAGKEEEPSPSDENQGVESPAKDDTAKSDGGEQVKEKETPASAQKTPASAEKKTPVPSAKKTSERSPSDAITQAKADTPAPSASVAPQSEREGNAGAEEADTPAEPTTEGTQTSTPESEDEPAEGTQTNGTLSSPGSIQINSGEGSYTVSVRLQEAGIISSASEFDRFLCQNGYDRKIRTGNFEIPVGADVEKIAQIITRTN